MEAVMSKLAVHVAEQVEAVPMLKIHEFVLTSLDNEEIDTSKVIESIKNFLKLLNKEGEFAVTAVNDTISITSLNGQALKLADDTSSEGFFVCQHCGRISVFEADLKDHEKIHYIGGF
jgi:Fe2+ or Zn2+ uptake regulation protein